jgi:flagella basal body P-ring formation protein FlgA
LVIGRWFLIIAWLLVFGYWLLLPAAALDNPEQKVTELIKDYVVAKYPNWTTDEINVIFKSAEQAFEELKDVPAAGRFKIVEVYADFKPVGNVIFPVEIEVSSEEVQKVFIRAKVEVLKKIAAASRLIKKGKVIESSDLKLEERDVALLPQKYYLDPNLLTGKEVKLSIPENSTIFEWMVGDLPLVRRGSEVSILVSAPALTVKAAGRALEDGYLDEAVRVKRRDSEKIIVCKVISTGEVEVELK